MSTLFCETTSVPVATSTPGRWKAVFLTPGAGTSGVYSEDVLKKYGPAALKKGAKSFVTHNRLENGEPDPFRMWGYLAEDAVYEDGVGLVGEIQVLPSWRERIEEVAPHTALSIYLMGESDDDGNVTEFFEDVQNGVDLVSYPGRPGSGLVEKLYEAAQQISANAENKNPAKVGANKEKEVSAMELTELSEKVDALAESLNTFVTSVTPLLESLKPAEVAELNVADVVETVIEAKLPKASRKAILESVANGVAIADAIKSESERVAEIRKELSETVSTPEIVGIGRVVVAEGEKQFSYAESVGVKVSA